MQRRPITSIRLGGVVALLLAGPLFAMQSMAQSPMTREAEPIGKGMISIDDYPDGSLRANEEGTTVVQYEIDELGRVTPGSCQVTSSSGHSRLDNKTCSIIEKRYRFKPALKEGVPVKSSKGQTIRWSLPDEPSQAEQTNLAVQIVHSRALCLLSSEPVLVQQILDLPLASPAQDKAIAAVDDDKMKCRGFDAQVRFPPMMLAGVLAERVIIKRANSGTELRLIPGDSSPAPRNATEGVAQCVARRNLATASALLSTEPTKTDEVAVVRQLVPDIQACIPAGLTLRLNQVSVRSLVAVGLYRETVSP